MFENYLLFGAGPDDIGAVKKSLEKVLGVELSPIDCPAWGKYYGTPQDPHEEVVSLYRNWEEGDYRKPDFSDYPLLVSVYDTENQDYYLDNILNAEGLRTILIKRTDRYDNNS